MTVEQIMALADSLVWDGYTVDKRAALRAAVEQMRDAALEEAAKKCEAMAWTNKASFALGPEMNCMDCAAAIRAMKGKQA